MLGKMNSAHSRWLFGHRPKSNLQSSAYQAINRPVDTTGYIYEQQADLTISAAHGSVSWNVDNSIQGQLALDDDLFKNQPVMRELMKRWKAADQAVFEKFNCYTNEVKEEVNMGC